MQDRGDRVSLWRRQWFWGVVLSSLVFLAYAGIWRAGFIWDDESHLTRNPCIIGPLGLKEVWTTTQAVYYPLVLTTLWALHKFAGLNPLPYHVLNVVLHAISAILLWRVLRSLRVRGAWLGAALWALHPVMVQSVAWVTELKNTQSSVFYLLSIFLFLKWQYAQQRADALSKCDAKSAAEQFSVPFFILSLACFVLATLSKTSVVMLPVVLALCIWWMRGKVQWRDALELAPFALVSALASVWTIWEQKFHARAVGPEWAHTFPETLIIAGRAVWFYVGKLLWPHPLIFIYPRWQIDSSKFLAFLPLLLGIAALIGLWSVRRTKWGRASFFGFSYYVISLFPVLGFFSVYFFRYSFVSDHFQYLASMGPLALAGSGIATFLPGLNNVLPLASRSDTAAVATGQGVACAQRSSFLSASVCGILLVLLGFLTWQQTADYRDLVALYTATLQKNPACWMAHYNLGIIFSERGDTDRAIDHYKQAVTLRPDYPEAHYNLGRLLVERGQVDEAIIHYEKALEINPADAAAENNLGVTLFAVGRVDDAIVHYRKALKTQPDYPDASCNLANALIMKGDLDDAIAFYTTCLAAVPDQAEAQYNLASALLRKGRTAEAIARYQKVIQLKPDSADAHGNLGSALLAERRVTEAIAEYRKALQISPQNVAALTNLAWLLATSADASLRNGDEAVRLAERADSVTSRSDAHPTVLRILAAAYAEAGRFSDAKATAQQAIQAANVQGNSTLADMVQGELALYDLSLPYHK